MAKVHITNVVVLDNPSSFLNPFQFELTFECIEELKEDLEWKMIYVGSAESEEYDQVLDTVSKSACKQSTLTLLYLHPHAFRSTSDPFPRVVTSSCSKRTRPTQAKFPNRTQSV